MAAIDIIIPTFRPRVNFFKTLDALSNQNLDDDTTYRIIVVDDGSQDEHLIDLTSRYSNCHLISLDKNQGRAAARNAGAEYSHGEYLLFLDSDCEIPNSNLVAKHCQLLAKGCDVVFGSIGPGTSENSFWTAYFSDIQRRRHQAAMAGDFLMLTSAHFSIRRKVFENIGGFDQHFRYYGFEDRDLFARLIKAKCSFHYNPSLIVLHEATLNLTDVCQKALEAGKFTSGLFAEKHPDIYKKMYFRYFDCRWHPIILSIPLCFSYWLMPLLPKYLDRYFLKSWLPKPFTYGVVKLFSALAFLLGTHQALRVPSAHCTDT